MSDADRIRQLEVQLDTAKRALVRYAKRENWEKDDWGIKVAFGPNYGSPWAIAQNALKRIEARRYRGD